MSALRNECIHKNFLKNDCCTHQFIFTQFIERGRSGKVMQWRLFHLALYLWQLRVAQCGERCRSSELKLFLRTPLSSSYFEDVICILIFSTCSVCNFVIVLGTEFRLQFILCEFLEGKRKIYSIHVKL